MNNYLRMGPKAPRILDLIERRIGGTQDATDKGVPYLAVDGVRIVYFARRRRLRVFSDREPTVTFEQWPELVQHILNRRPRLTHDQLIAMYEDGRSEAVLAELKRHGLIEHGESVPDVMERLAAEPTHALDEDAATPQVGLRLP